MSIQKDEKGCLTKSIHYCIVAARDRVFGGSCDFVEQIKIYAKAPNIIFDNFDVLLMRFRSKGDPKSPG